MNSIAMAWEKRKPNEVKILNEKSRGPKRLVKKTTTSKQKQRTQIIEQEASRTVRFDNLLPEANPYKPLQPTRSVLNPTNHADHEIVIYKDRTLCSSRAAVATFIIVVIIIVLAALSVGLTFGIANSQNSSASGNNNNQNSLGSGSTQLSQSTISVVGGNTGSPCTSYTSINDPSRNANYTGNSSPCDNGYPFATSNGGAWIRFQGSGGTQIPTWPVDMNHCGAVLGVWSNSTLPTASNTNVSGTACGIGASYLCIYTFDISIMYCGSYYVYFLPPVTACNLRYCTT